jgi:hypothetical protein
VKEIALNTLSRMSEDLEAFGHIDSKSYVGEYTQALEARFRATGKEIASEAFEQAFELEDGRIVIEVETVLPNIIDQVIKENFGGRDE